MLPSSYNDWTLVSLSPWPLVAKILGALVVVLACALVVWSYRAARRRLPLTLLRVLGALVVLGFLIEPALQLRVVRKVRNRLAVIVDRSRSMTLASSDGRSRYDHVLALFEDGRDELAALNESHVVELFDLDGPLSTGALSSPPTGERSDLLGGLERARDAGAGRPLAGLVLISDGVDNAGLEGDERGRLSKDAVRRLQALDAPVSTISAALAQSFKDVAIVDVVVDEFAFVHNTVEIDVHVEAAGLGSLSLPMTLKREGEVVGAQEVALGEGEPASVQFKFKPDEIGEFVYMVSVPPLSGEAITSNNQRSFVLQVIRDKIRVLQVSGRPSWDERFLRQHLKENPNVDLISFFILRTPSDTPGAAETELSLIPFPVDELFTTKLKSFDVVIFQNFDYRPYGMSQYLSNIRDAVNEGLGFVMMGGEQSFAGGGYLGTAIDEILPVRLESGEFSETQVTPALTTAGRRHPVTDLTRGSGSNERLWQELPPWRSLNLTAGVPPGATALVVDARMRGGDGQLAPLVAVADVGRGRAMALLSDSMWRWRFALHHDGGAAERAYHRFWSNALHWLVRDPEHSRVRVLPDKRRFELNEPIDVTITVRGRDYQPVPSAHVRATLDQAGVGTRGVDDVGTGETGAARQRYQSLGAGAYRVTAVAQAAGESLGSGTGVFTVEPRSLELDRAAPRPDLLAALAKGSGGQALHTESSALANLALNDPDVVEIDRRRNIELWDNAWALLFGVILLAAEWALRRRSGYL